MGWTAIKVVTTNEAVEAVSYILTDEGAVGVQIDDAADFKKLKPGRYGQHGEIIDPQTIPHRQSGAAITGYFPEKTFVPEIVPAIKQRVQQLAQFNLDPGDATIVADRVNDEKWATVWQKYYHPLRVTNRLTIVPEWEQYHRESPDEKLIILDPGMAFGTGTHPTTQLMLEALEIIVRGGESMIDVGTGSGVLSIAAKHLGAGVVTAYDIDEVAVRSAKRNLALNPVAADVKVGVNSLLDGVHTQVDLIVANILAEIIVPLVPQAMDNLRPGGHFLVSGIIKDKAELVRRTLIDAGFIIDQQLRMKDWYGMIAHKPTEDEQ